MQVCFDVASSLHTQLGIMEVNNSRGGTERMKFKEFSLLHLNVSLYLCALLPPPSLLLLFLDKTKIFSQHIPFLIAICALKGQRESRKSVMYVEKSVYALSS
jgi:hypothetical protein